MRTTSIKQAFGLCAVSLLLTSCGNPYALKATSPRYHAIPTTGSIQFTDPKLYRRELLINERRVEIEYLDELIKGSTTVQFSPEIIRELQIVTALAGAVGLSIDPAAGDDYKNWRERSDIQSEIDNLKLQLQLDKLKREAELIRASLPAQTEVSADVDLQPGQAVAPGLSTASADKLIVAINNLTSLLSTGLAGKGEALVKGGAAQNPSDLFQDRAAYRNMLNSAKNAASLDELHDRDGASLLRLHFSATVFPPKGEYADTFGLLRMQINRPSMKYHHIEELYVGWLGYINGIANLPAKGKDGRFELNPALIGLVSSNELFDTGYFYYGTRKDKSTCQGIVLERDTKNRECGELIIALPRVRSTRSEESGTSMSIKDMYNNLVSQNMCYSDAFIEARAFLARTPDFDIGDRLPDPSTGAAAAPARVCMKGPGAHGLPPQRLIEAAMFAQLVSTQLSRMELQAHKILIEHDISRPPSSPALTGFTDIGLVAGNLVTAYIGHAQRRKKILQVSDFVATSLPYRFTDTVISPGKRVAIYDVGPREQMQQLSTVARAAEAIGLAAAITGKVPKQGIGIDSNIAYSRSATGKADALERVPLAISFAEAGSESALPAFGWLLGPRVTLHPEEQQLVLEQRLKTYDLSVDLSVPGWWPYLELVPETAWAPSWLNDKGAPTGSGGNLQPIQIQLPKNSGDFSALTNHLSGNTSVRYASIDSLEPDAISACNSDLSLQITGDNIWRASTIIVGGRKFDGSAISVMPDMNGVIVAMTATGFPAFTTNAQGVKHVKVTVLTPYGRPETKAALVGAQADGTCAVPKQAAPAAQKDPPKNDQKPAAGAAASP